MLTSEREKAYQRKLYQLGKRCDELKAQLARMATAIGERAMPLPLAQMLNQATYHITAGIAHYKAQLDATYDADKRAALEAQIASAKLWKETVGYLADLAKPPKEVQQ